MKSIYVLLLVTLFSIEIECQWATDPNINNSICMAVNDQFSSQIISDFAGGAIIVWDDFRNGANYDIYAQRINNLGVVQWSANGVIIVSLANDQAMPKIISDGIGDAIIVWNDFRGGNYSDIYAQKISSNGTVQWTANGVSICSAVNSQNNPAIICDGAGGAIITWQDQRDGNLDIYAQHINSSGTVSWPSEGVPICNAINKQENPAIASDSYGGAIITWQDYRSNVDYDTYAQRIDVNGSVLWTVDGNSVCNLLGNQVYPNIIQNKTDEVIITWFDVRNGIDADIYSQRFNIDGNVLWANNGVALCNATNLQQFPVLVDDGSGGAIAAWQDYRAGSFDVYVQRINMNGDILWTTDGVPISTETNAQMSPEIISDGQGGAIITWRDHRDNGNQDIYAQCINSSGIIQWTENGIAISTAQNDQYTPDITNDGAGGAIIVWWDYRNGSTSDIYVQQVNNNGQLGVVTDVKDGNSASLKLFKLEQNYPNPFNPSTRIRFEIPIQAQNDNALVTLKVYDVHGNEVADLVNKETPGGTYNVELSIEKLKLSSGVYFYQLKAGGFIQTKKMILLK